jgi:ABC-type phosphate transport system substrate-binding protein
MHNNMINNHNNKPPRVRPRVRPPDQPQFRPLLLPLVLQGMLAFTAYANDFSVIVHPNNPVVSLTAEQVSDLYLGRSRNFETGNRTNAGRAIILEHPENAPIRSEFYRALNGMSISRLTVYWARVRFSGQILPPQQLPNSQQIIETVKNQQFAIGYVESHLVDRSVKVVLRLKP